MMTESSVGVGEYGGSPAGGPMGGYVPQQQQMYGGAPAFGGYGGSPSGPPPGSHGGGYADRNLDNLIRSAAGRKKDD